MMTYKDEEYQLLRLEVCARDKDALVLLDAGDRCITDKEKYYIFVDKLLQQHILSAKRDAAIITKLRNEVKSLTTKTIKPYEGKHCA